MMARRRAEEMPNAWVPLRFSGAMMEIAAVFKVRVARVVAIRFWERSVNQGARFANIFFGPGGSARDLLP